MSISKLAVAFLILAGSCQNVIAADLKQSCEGKQRIGVVSAQGATTLSTLENVLSQKASKAGAECYKIIAAGGNNRLSGVAVIYK
ncbi:YdgH/BhsA/McbA-like domain containing protein [Kluyvera sp. STS39-E]|uniref:YdgH/BhsA/McbA-like domain containing protein n=1 Tax=Enterobacteriaceae TaxID=543 RepID=UPI000E3D2CF2|nr:MULTISPECIES: YdgH/BhsA/McbA-like domain containing protein [Citrobacter]MBD0826601.1 DUF1471 domain-containing protein [Citrobacter sp. C1]RFU93324.1 DUF1471 domain-containing protein [Citrobacter gillenii]